MKQETMLIKRLQKAFEALLEASTPSQPSTDATEPSAQPSVATAPTPAVNNEPQASNSSSTPAGTDINDPNTNNTSGSIPTMSPDNATDGVDNAAAAAGDTSNNMSGDSNGAVDNASGGGFVGGGDSVSDEQQPSNDGVDNTASMDTPPDQSPSTPPEDPVSDAVSKLSDLAAEAPSSKNDALSLIKATKGIIQQNFTSKAEVADLIDKLAAIDTPSLKDLAERLRTIIAITNSNNVPDKEGTDTMKSPATPANKKNQNDESGLTPLQESIVREIVSEIVTKVISENSSYTAMRKLAIQAQETSLDFEKNIVTLLGVLDPDLMETEARQVYHKAAEGMKEKMVNAVLTAAQLIARLPKKDENKPT